MLLECTGKIHFLYILIKKSIDEEVFRGRPGRPVTDESDGAGCDS